MVQFFHFFCPSVCVCVCLCLCVVECSMAHLCIYYFVLINSTFYSVLCLIYDSKWWKLWRASLSPSLGVDLIKYFGCVKNLSILWGLGVLQISQKVELKWFWLLFSLALFWFLISCYETFLYNTWLYLIPVHSQHTINKSCCIYLILKTLMYYFVILMIFL